jgi:hypothetical protein
MTWSGAAQGQILVIPWLSSLDIAALNHQVTVRIPIGIPLMSAGFSNVLLSGMQVRLRGGNAGDCWGMLGNAAECLGMGKSADLERWTGWQHIGLCLDYRLWVVCEECKGVDHICDPRMAVRLLSLGMDSAGLQRSFDPSQAVWDFRCRVWHLRCSSRNGMLLRELQDVLDDRALAMAAWVGALFRSGQVDGRVEFWFNACCNNDAAFKLDDDMAKLWDKVSLGGGGLWMGGGQANERADAGGGGGSSRTTRWRCCGCWRRSTG